jgi:5'-3' exonuclease
MILLNCIIDGNYLLHRHVHTLHKNNLLFGGLEKSLEVAINNYRKWYPFANIYFVSDSKKKSWRSKFKSNYKTKRQKNPDIDWKFVYATYEEFKSKLSYKKIKLFELDHIEGDDWVSFIAAKTNAQGQSNLIVSNDYDIKQIIKFNLEPFYINFMTNEFFNKQKYFLPKNYKIFIDSLKKNSNDSIFEMSDDTEFIRYFSDIEEKYEVNEIDSLRSLLIKVISGDISDNIGSVFITSGSGRKRGIGEKGAESILEMYKNEFGEPSLTDPDLIENIADLICEKKKLNRNHLPQISENIKKNMKMINLDIQDLPSEVVNKMNTLVI